VRSSASGALGRNRGRVFCPQFSTTIDSSEPASRRQRAHCRPGAPENRAVAYQKPTSANVGFVFDGNVKFWPSSLELFAMPALDLPDEIAGCRRKKRRVSWERDIQLA
jgi:hypothetical protein